MNHTMRVEQLDRILCEVFDAIFSENDAEIIKNYSRDIAEELAKSKYEIQIDETIKDTPKRPVLEKFAVDMEGYLCPNCGEDVLIRDKHCKECGQALDWRIDN